MFTFLVVVSWLIIFPSVAGVLARKKDRSVIGWVLLVLFLTPIWILLLLALPTKGKTCPSCAEIVKWDAQICRYCQHQFPTQVSASESPPFAQTYGHGYSRFMHYRARHLYDLSA
jgi:Uncharacterised protein family UPF0547